jgi:ABC-type Fe3+ transport system permease subunit
VAGIFVTGWWWVVKVKLYSKDQVCKWLVSTVNLSTLSAQITVSIGILAGRNKVKLKINQSKILLVFHSH